MRNLYSPILVVFVCCIFIAWSCSHPGIVKPTQEQTVWADAEIGVLIDLDIITFAPDYSLSKLGTPPDAVTFNPTALNTDQWLETAQKLGATAVLVAKHSSGFSLWPTEAHDYSVKNSPWKDGSRI